MKYVVLITLFDENKIIKTRKKERNKKEKKEKESSVKKTWKAKTKRNQQQLYIIIKL